MKLKVISRDIGYRRWEVVLCLGDKHYMIGEWFTSREQARQFLREIKGNH